MNNARAVRRECKFPRRAWDVALPVWQSLNYGPPVSPPARSKAREGWRFSPRKRSIAPPRNGWFGIARAPEEKRQGTTALHDASRSSRRVGLMRQLLECACPLALFPLGTGAPELRTLRRESGRALPSSTACRPSTNQQIFVKKSSLLFLSRAGNLFVLVRGVA